MSSRLWTALVAILLLILGVVGGGMGSAWWMRDLRAKPWSELRVEHQGTYGATTRTRVIFDNPKVALQGVEVVRSPKGDPESARVEIRGAAELAVGYDAGGDRPTSLEGPNGELVRLSYGGGKARVTFITADDKTIGERVVKVPVELRSALAFLHRDDWSIIGVAHAQVSKEPDDPQVIVEREVVFSLDIRTAGKSTPGSARVEASCDGFTCLPLTPEVAIPGKASVRIGVSAGKKQSTLGAAPSGNALDDFKEVANEERNVAVDVMPNVATVVAAVSVTAEACASLQLGWPQCVPALAKNQTAGAALHAVAAHTVSTQSHIITQRATELYYQERARAALDKPTNIEVCISRSGYTRACTKVKGSPLAAKPMAPQQRALEVRRGISGTLEGSFVMTQADGPDCKFSPSPKTSGTLQLTFDDKKGTVTGRLSANERGTRSGLSCSLGSGDMRWSQNYSATLNQTFTQAQLQAGGRLPLRLVGSMSGSGSSSQSNCRTRGGASAGCPGGRSETYNYPIELLGDLDLETQTGSGRLSVRNAPLSTNGSWQVPAAKGAR